MKNLQTLILRFAVLCSFCAPCLWTLQTAYAVNITVNKGWPCNVFIEQIGAGNAVGNYADFNYRTTPASVTTVSSFIAGASADFLTSQGLTFDNVIADLPFVEPLSFNFKSDTLGAKLGVDVCIKEINETREDVIEWTIDAIALAALMPPAQGNWFSQTMPKISISLLASNCNAAPGSNLSLAAPQKVGFCEITSEPLPGANVLAQGGLPIPFKFRLQANRQAVFRVLIEEQNSGQRRQTWDAGVVQLEFTDPPLPPLLVGDLLGKQLFFEPDPDLIQWPGCANFNNKMGIAFEDVNLQGPNSSLDLRWTGKDADCSSAGTCADGNKRTNGFTFPVAVYLEDGSLAPSNASPTAKVRNFEGLFDDVVASGESQFPSNARIVFDATLDEVYRSGSKALFSTTVSRLIAPDQWQSCRVWFKRDNGFDCSSLPTTTLVNLCSSM